MVLDTSDAETQDGGTGRISSGGRSRQNFHSSNSRSNVIKRYSKALVKY